MCVPTPALSMEDSTIPSVGQPTPLVTVPPSRIPVLDRTPLHIPRQTPTHAPPPGIHRPPAYGPTASTALAHSPPIPYIIKIDTGDKTKDPLEKITNCFLKTVKYMSPKLFI